MTAANEKPTIELLPCPFCGGEAAMGGRHDYAFVNCTQCLASTNILLAEQHKPTKTEAAEQWNTRAQPATGSITATCKTISNLPYTVGQTAEDDAEYTQGLAYDGVVILKDGQPITIDEVLAMLNARSGTVDEAKEREAYDKWENEETHRSGREPDRDAWLGWLARARGGQAG